MLYYIILLAITSLFSILWFGAFTLKAIAPNQAWDEEHKKRVITRCNKSIFINTLFLIVIAIIGFNLKKD